MTKASFFRHAAALVTGALIFYAPVARAAADQVTKARYYWYSAIDAAHKIQRSGRAKFVGARDRQINFTTVNFNGKNPGHNADLVHFNFGPAEIESHLVLDGAAYRAYSQRAGIKVATSVLVDRDSRQPGDAERRKPVGEFNPKNKLG